MHATILQRRIYDAKRDVLAAADAYRILPTLENRNELRIAQDYLASLNYSDAEEEDRMEALNERRMTRDI